MSRAWRHLDVTHVPLVIQVRDLFFIKSQKMIFFTLKQCVFLDFRGCEGSGACFERLRMRSRSRRKCAHRNAGDLESSLEVCACVYDPIHVTAQGKSLGPNCACVQPPRHYRGLPMNACVLYPMGWREFSWPYMGLRRHLGHMTYMLDSDWLKKFLLRSDWLGPIVALYTTANWSWSVFEQSSLEEDQLPFCNFPLLEIIPQSWHMLYPLLGFLND